MAQAKSSGALAQYGPVAAPLAGLLLAILFIAGALMTSGISEGNQKLSATVQSVRKQMDNPKAEVTDTDIPLVDTVTASLTPGPNDSWKTPAGSHNLLALPITWDVQMEGPQKDEFAQYDENNDGYWDQMEFQRTPYFGRTTADGAFVNWDRNPVDGLISREEYNDPPRSDREAFDELDKNQDGFLTAKDGEVTTEEEYNWDRHPFDGKIDFQEYVDRYKPKDEVDLGPATGVQARLDPATMEIVVTWNDPDLATAPADLAYMLERRAPETVAKRMTEWRKKVQEYNAKLRAWEGRFEKWWNAAPAEGQKSNKQLFPRKPDAEKEYAKSDAKPVPQPQPDEWEPVNVTPFAGNEYRDNSFDLDVTYTYAVKMATKSNPKRGQRAVQDESLPGWYVYPDRVATEGHPVVARNRVEMKWSGAAPPNGTIQMITWHKVSVGDAHSWYRVQVTEIFGPDNDVIGGKFNLSQLRDRGVKMFDTAGTEVNATEILTSDAEIDFTTGFRFVTTTSKGFLLSSREVGDFELTKATQQAAAPDTPAGSDDSLEVRCLAVKSGAKEATFELTRWTKAGDDWLRVIWTGSAASGKEVGAEIALDKASNGVVVKDATGKTLSASDLKKYKDHTVDMKAGTFDGLKDRTVTVGGSDFDLFGTLYVG
jgi:hypothetical protein